MKINLGVDICFALKRWPNPDEWIDIVKNELKLDLIEFDSDFLDPLYNRNSYIDIAYEIRELTKKNNIKIHNYFTGNITHSVNFLTHPDKRLKNDSYAWCIGAIDIASILCAGGIGANFNNIPHAVRGNRKLLAGMIKEFLDDIIKLADYSGCKDLNFILMEQMYSPSELPYRITQAGGFISYLNRRSKIPVKLVIDVGHMCNQNFKHSYKDSIPNEWIRHLGKITEVIHLQQTDQFKSQHWPFTEYYNKKGIIKPKEILDAIQSSGTKEINLIFEVFSPLYKDDHTVLKEMKESVDLWKYEIENFKPGSNIIQQ